LGEKSACCKPPNAARFQQRNALELHDPGGSNTLCRQEERESFAMRKYRTIVLVTGIALAASAIAAAAQSNDSATCDRLAAFPDDPDKPAGVAGNYEIPRDEIATALKACKAAAHAAGATHRTWFELGRAYEFSRQHGEAAKAYRKAIEAGSTSAMVGLGGLYAKGAGVKADPAEARKLFEQAATAGNSLGMINLGSVYGAGIGVPVDFAKARSWFEKAAAANSAEAMFQLGMMTQDGDGGPKDDVAAKAWFEKAAALDHAGALERLGAYAEAGRAGAKDAKTALTYYKKAAALGDEDAQASLDRLRCPFTLKDKNGKVAGSICYDGDD
jgi:TPR repeat protein